MTATGMTAGGESTSLYRLFDQDDALLYIGVARRFGTRWHQHAQSKYWWPQVRHQTLEWHPSREAAEAAERAAVKAERPKYNIIFNADAGPRQAMPVSRFLVAARAAAAAAERGHLIEDLLSPAKAAAFLAISEDGLARLDLERKGPVCHWVEGEARYDPADLRTFVMAGTRPLRARLPQRHQVPCPDCSRRVGFAISDNGDQATALCLNCGGRLEIKILPGRAEDRGAA
jgi:predicted GIY-YIG superfamily endonuclease